MQNNMTEKVLNILSKSQELAIDNSNCEIDVSFLIKAMLLDSDSMLKNVLRKINVSVDAFTSLVENDISLKAKSSNVDNVYISSDLNNLLKNAEKYKKSFGDSFISVEHLILALFDSKHPLIKKLTDIENFPEV